MGGGGDKAGGGCLPACLPFIFPLLICSDEEAAISQSRRGAECAHIGLEIEFIVVIIPDHDEAVGPHTYMLVLAVEVSQSAASPTMSNPVES